MKAEEYKTYDATGLAQLIKDKKISEKELLDISISVIENKDKHISAIVTKAYEHGERQIQEGLPNGYFKGVPFLLKDLNVSCKGLPTTLSNKLFTGNIANSDSNLVKLYKKAGLVIIGLTKTPELALSLTTEPIANGPTKNPLNPKNSPGGSSGGSAASVAAGYVPMAHATDGGGSIRVPASLCGLFGLKPSRGRISNGPDIGEALGGMAVSHCLSKSVRDSAALLDISKEFMVGEPYSAPNDQDIFKNFVDRDPGILKIAVMTTDFEGNKIDAEIKSKTLAAAKICEDLGHIVEEIEIDLTQLKILDAWRILPAINLLNNMKKRSDFLKIELKEHHLEPLNWAWHEEGKKYNAVDYMEAINNMHKIGRIIGEYFIKYDLLLTPTVAKKELPLGVIKTNHTNVEQHINYLFRELAPHTAIFNQTGGPAMSLPMQQSDNNAPFGMHFAGKIGDEGKLISLAGQIERNFPWT
tara:strand:+ start:2996 stop:4405 length:1410 start_codon:yes stop_codon:yes gene_type:complete